MRKFLILLFIGFVFVQGCAKTEEEVTKEEGSGNIVVEASTPMPVENALPILRKVDEVNLADIKLDEKGNSTEDQYVLGDSCSALLYINDESYQMLEANSKVVISFQLEMNTSCSVGYFKNDKYEDIESFGPHDYDKEAPGKHEVEFSPEEEGQYAFAITNRSSTPLYIDMISLKIQ